MAPKIGAMNKKLYFKKIFPIVNKICMSFMLSYCKCSYLINRIFEKKKILHFL